jgi:murein DD-endopeptidase MepM/ murein hydrolase activator NlpD
MRSLTASLYLFAVLTIGCQSGATYSSISQSQTQSSQVSTRKSTGNPFDDFLQTDIAPADGFDFPFGDANGQGAYTDQATGKTHQGWYVATRFGEKYSLGLHPGEDWNGRGGGNTDLGQPVFAVAQGRVVFAEQCGQPWGNVIVIEHVFYENNEQRRIRSLYAHLQTMKVKRGATVQRRQQIGAIGQDPDRTFGAHLHLELRWDESLAPTYWPSSHGKDLRWVREHYAEPSSFIAARRRLFVPQQEATLLLVDQASYKMRLYQRGQLRGEYDISLGQGVGPKRVQGDNKTPKGMYFVIGKHRGKFEGAYGAYYGGHWIKVNYPNKYDAARGRADGLITAQQESAIAAAWEQRQATLENTRLGGGIGFHGWAQEWKNEGPRHLSWGCVVMHIYDIRKLFDQIPAGAMVVIF